MRHNTMRFFLKYTLIELLITISIIAILFSILMPVLKNVKNKANAIVCTNNLQQMTTGMFSYLGDSNDWMPVYGGWDSVNRWSNVLTSNGYCSKKSFNCPSNSDSLLKPVAIGIRLLWGGTSLDTGVKMTKMNNISMQLLFGDATSVENIKRGSLFTNSGHFQYRHYRKATVSYLDGHVASADKALLSNGLVVIYW